MPFIPKTDLAFLSDLAARISTINPASVAGVITDLDANRLLSITNGETRLETDQRTTKRIVRIRLFPDGAEEPAADSEPNLPADAGGTWVIDGLPAVALALAQIAFGYHRGAVMTGLDKETLERRINGLRPTLSRRGGDAVWRVPYKVDGLPWSARVDVKNS